MGKKDTREFLMGQAFNVFTAIKELTDEELQDTLEMARDLSTTNCWWGLYKMKGAFISIIEDRINEIKILRKKSTP